MSRTPPGKSGDTKTRQALLDASMQLMLEEGYAAVTTRKAATKAGVNPALVYYYFRTIDELFLAVLRRGAQANLKRLERAAADDEPLRALWRVTSEPVESALVVEFTALANHRPAIREELAAYTREFRAMQEQIVRRALHARGLDSAHLPPSAFTLLMRGLASTLVSDATLGITDGHDETRAFVETFLKRYSGPEPASHGTVPDAGSA